MRILNLDDRATAALVGTTMIGVFFLSVRLLIWADKFHTGLLYIALPFCLSVALYYLTPDTDGATWLRRFWNNLRLTLIVMFASSLILMEGYVCVVMFLPIFVFITILAFLACFIANRSRKGSVGVYVLPAVVLLLSLEGVSEATTLDRYIEVSYSRIVQADTEEIVERLTQPIRLRGDRHWILSVFPMPRHIGTVSLKEGEVRSYEFVYHRWFVTNTHAGSVDVTLTEVGPDRIVTRIDDSSYLSGYVKLRGTEFGLYPLDQSRTRVTLTIRFDRLLDPAWYFEPLQRFVVGKGAEYFLDQVLGDATWDGGRPTVKDGRDV